jgi:hypothetical protein
LTKPLAERTALPRCESLKKSKVAPMSTIEVELWNIFTCYTLHGNPRDPSRISETQFLKLCKDSSVMNPAMVDAPLNQATLHLIWTSELKVEFILLA